MDLLGHVYQELRNPKATKAHGEICGSAAAGRADPDTALFGPPR
jgi:hypothetical protein